MDTYEDMFELTPNGQNNTFIQNPYVSSVFDITKTTHVSLTHGASQ
jgi:hypothetical protein